MPTGIYLFVLWMKTYILFLGIYCLESFEYFSDQEALPRVTRQGWGIPLSCSREARISRQVK